MLDILNDGQNYIIKQDNKRSRPKTINRSKLRTCYMRVNVKLKEDTEVISIHDIKPNVNHQISEQKLNNLSILGKNGTPSIKKRGRPTKIRSEINELTSNNITTISDDQSNKKRVVLKLNSFDSSDSLRDKPDQLSTNKDNINMLNDNVQGNSNFKFHLVIIHIISIY